MKVFGVFGKTGFASKFCPLDTGERGEVYPSFLETTSVNVALIGDFSYEQDEPLPIASKKCTHPISLDVKRLNGIFDLGVV